MTNQLRFWSECAVLGRSLSEQPFFLFIGLRLMDERFSKSAQLLVFPSFLFCGQMGGGRAKLKQGGDIF